MVAPAIIDTNVVVAGLLTARPESPVARTLDDMLAAALPFVLSEALLAEYRTVMLRPRLRKAHGLQDDQIDAILIELAHHAIVLQPQPAARKAPDPGDQHLWDLLHARGDLVLVTGDIRLLEAADMRHRVVSPRAFIHNR